MEDSSITDNGGAGINGFGGTNENQELTLENTVIQGNEGKMIIAYNPTDPQFGTAVEAQDVTLDGGLSGDFDQQRVTLGTVPVEGATTDALNVTGADSIEIVTEFQVDGETGELWLRAGGDWESHGEYETTNGTFQETVGQGAWMATTVT